VAAEVVIDQYGKGNAVAASQNGKNNFTRILQQGKGNNLTSQQNGKGNRMIAGQEGNFNYAFSYQGGKNNLIGVAQMGKNNNAVTTSRAGTMSRRRSRSATVSTPRPIRSAAATPPSSSRATDLPFPPPGAPPRAPARFQEMEASHDASALPPSGAPRPGRRRSVAGAGMALGPAPVPMRCGFGSATRRSAGRSSRWPCPRRRCPATTTSRSRRSRRAAPPSPRRAGILTPNGRPTVLGTAVFDRRGSIAAELTVRWSGGTVSCARTYPGT
jgi:hypothetical protein